MRQIDQLVNAEVCTHEISKEAIGECRHLFVISLLLYRASQPQVHMNVRRRIYKETNQVRKDTPNR